MSDEQGDGRVDDSAVPLLLTGPIDGTLGAASGAGVDIHADDSPDEVEPRPPVDPVAILGLVALLLLLPVIALGLGYWSQRRTGTGAQSGGSLARGTVLIGWVELFAVIAFWIVYFAVLAPVVALPR